MSFTSTKVLTATALLLSLAGCSSDKTAATPENRVTFNDFESMDGWAEVPVTTEKAHSGRYSIKVDKAAEFSLGYTSILSKVSPTKINTIALSAWAMRTSNDAKAVIVVEVTNPADPAQKIFWESMDLHEQVKTFNTWTKVSKEFKLPATIQPTYRLRVYMWLAGATQPTYLDDVEITKS